MRAPDTRSLKSDAILSSLSFRVFPLPLAGSERGAGDAEGAVTEVVATVVGGAVVVVLEGAVAGIFADILLVTDRT